MQYQGALLPAAKIGMIQSSAFTAFYCRSSSPPSVESVHFAVDSGKCNGTKKIHQMDVIKHELETRFGGARSLFYLIHSPLQWATLPVVHVQFHRLSFRAACVQQLTNN